MSVSVLVPKANISGLNILCAFEARLSFVKYNVKNYEDAKAFFETPNIARDNLTLHG